MRHGDEHAIEELIHQPFYIRGWKIVEVADTRLEAFFSDSMITQPVRAWHSINGISNPVYISQGFEQPHGSLFPFLDDVEVNEREPLPVVFLLFVRAAIVWASCDDDYLRIRLLNAASVFHTKVARPTIIREPNDARSAIPDSSIKVCRVFEQFNFGSRYLPQDVGPDQANPEREGIACH